MIGVLLAIVVGLGAFFRLFNLGTLPISLFGDEVDVGYHAWSLITTGRDYMGHLLPTYIQSLTEWRAPLLMYITAPFVGILGPTDLAIRLPVALIGIASIYLIYLLSKTLFLSQRSFLVGTPARRLLAGLQESHLKLLPLLSALLLALTPWHIHYSRTSFEVVPLIFLEMLGTYLFIKKKVFVSFIPFALTLYTYSTASVFTPLLVITLIFIYRPDIFKTKNIWKFALSIILILPLIYSIFFGQAAGRFKGISIFNDTKIIDNLIIQRTDPWVSKSSTEVFFHNKYFAYATAFGENYLKAFSPEFLFLQGDPNFRQSISGQGELLWIVLPFLLYGLFLTLKDIGERSFRLMLAWLLIAPIASSLTQGGGTHATRLFLMIPPLVIISALGLEKFISLHVIPCLTRNLYKLSILLIFILFAFSFANYWHRYSAHYRYESAAMWQSGYEDIFAQLKPLLEDSQNVYINNTAAPSLTKFALFTKYPPSEFQKNYLGNDPDTFDNGLFKGFRFGDKYYFGEAINLETLQKLLQPGDIYLAAQGKEIPGDWDWSKTPPTGFKAFAIIYDPLGNPQFTLIRKE